MDVLLVPAGSLPAATACCLLPYVEIKQSLSSAHLADIERSLSLHGNVQQLMA